MLRTAYLKYSLQARIGNMDGIFVAYHNTARMFGFEYISLERMEYELYGSSNIAEKYFSLSTQLLNKVLTMIVKHFPNQDVDLHITAPKQNSVLIFAIDPRNDAKGICLQLSTYSVVNQVYQNKPSAPLDDWKLYYQIDQIPFVQSKYLNCKRSFDYLHNNSRRRNSNSFNERLKQSLGYD
jgi:hypothetical protein